MAPEEPAHAARFVHAVGEPRFITSSGLCQTTAQLQAVRLHALVGATGSMGDDGESALEGDVSIRGGAMLTRSRSEDYDKG